MTRQLFVQAMIKFLAGLILTAVLLFIPAGTLRYPQAWFMILLVFVPIFIAGIYMMVKNPDLLRKRLQADEKEPEQQKVIKASGIMFASAFFIAGLSFRFHWLMLPARTSRGAAVLLLTSYVFFGEVLRENTWLSRTVEVQENQKVIDTGLYGVVRHPMYMTTLVFFLMMPLVLGSILSFIIMLGYIPIIAKRMENEEKVLEEGLPGYREYKKKVRYKIIPFIW